MSSIADGFGAGSVSLCDSCADCASDGLIFNAGLLAIAGAVFVLRFFRRAQVVGNDLSLI